MDIFLMQHGDCFTKEEDPEQSLTPTGKEQIHCSSQALKKMDVCINGIVASTKKRALQTAQIVAETLDFPMDKILKTDLLKPMTSADETISFISRYGNQGPLLLAGHLPSLAEVASALISEARVKIHFQRGGVGKIVVAELPTHSGELHWYLTPDQLRRVASSPTPCH